MFWLVDLVLIGLCIWLSRAYSLKPADAAALPGSSARLAVTLLVGIRLSIRMLPHVLNTIELFSFRTLVAARHLRARKSGFLAAIGFLSILAVSVSSCALTTTLSVMGGFRQDLKRKILGNNAHIVVDRPDGRIAADADPSRLIRAVPGVRGVSTYVSGEVMISSSSNLAGAVLRGIDPAHIAEVSELPKTMRVGSLDYLSHPEKLARLPVSQLGFATGATNAAKFAPKVQRGNTDSDVKALQGKRLTEQLDEALRKRDLEEAGQGSADDEPALERRGPERTLPGIVVGQELARSLRLYLGDEVNIVTPLGALGPTRTHAQVAPVPRGRHLLQRHVRVRHEVRLRHAAGGAEFPRHWPAAQRRRGDGRRARSCAGRRAGDRPQAARSQGCACAAGRSSTRTCSARWPSRSWPCSSRSASPSWWPASASSAR